MPKIVYDPDADPDPTFVARSEGRRLVRPRLAGSRRLPPDRPIGEGSYEQSRGCHGKVRYGRREVEAACARSAEAFGCPMAWYKCRFCHHLHLAKARASEAGKKVPRRG